MKKSSYKNVYDNAISHINKKEYSSAYDLVRDYEDLKDILVYRIFYKLHSRKDSPLYSPEKAKVRLDGLVRFGDSWGASEKGKCLLYGNLYPQSTVDAEDLLVKSGTDQIASLFYRAEIHFKGLHKDSSGEPIVDMVEAEELYREIIERTKDKALLHKTKLNLCRLLMSKENKTSVESVEIYQMLIGLKEKGFRNADKVLFELLCANLRSLIPSLFDDESELHDHQSKITNEARRRVFRKSITAMMSSVNGDS